MSSALITPEKTAEALERYREDKKAGKVSLADSSTISKEIVAALAYVIPPETVAQTIASLMTASRTLKNGTVLPDTRAQDSGVKLYLAYMVGLPVQKTESVNITLDADSAVGMEDRLRKSPALRQALKGILEKVENAEAVEIDPA